MDVEGVGLVGQRKNGKIFLVSVLGGETPPLRLCVAVYFGRE